MAAPSPNARTLVEKMIARPFEQWLDFLQENESALCPEFVFAMEQVARELAERGEGGSLNAVGLRSMAEHLREYYVLGPVDRSGDYRTFLEAMAATPDADPGPLLQGRFRALLEDPSFGPTMRKEAERFRQAGDENRAPWLEKLANTAEGPLLLIQLLECVTRDGEQAAPAVFSLLEKHGASITDAVLDNAPQALASMLDCANGFLRQQTAISMGILGQIVQTWQRERIFSQELSICLTEAALSVFTQSEFPQQWATAQNQLSITYRERIRGDRMENLKGAIEAGEAACTVLSAAAFPREWGFARMNVANALMELTDEGLPDHIERALQAYADAAQTLTEHAFPKDWAKLNVNTANAWMQRVRGVAAANVEQSIACLNNALRILTEQGDGELWATAEMNLATAYLFRVDGVRSGNLTASIHACEQALRVFKRETFPVKWASVRMNWASAKREQSADALDSAAAEHALAAYGEVLDVFTLEDFPEFWAKVHLNMALAWSDRVSGTRAENIERSIGSARSALTIYTREGWATEWAKLQLALGRAYLEREVGKAAENLTVAAGHAAAAQRVFTIESDPTRWSAAQELLGIAHARLVEINPAHHFAEAVTALTRTLEALRPESKPDEWTRAQVALGDLYHHVASLGNPVWFMPARQAYGKALTVLQVTGDPARCLEVALRLGELAANANDWEEARNAFRVAADVYERNRGHALRDNEPGAVAITANLIYERLVEACLRTGRSEEAAEFATRAASPAFTGMLVATRLESDARKLNDTAQEHISIWEAAKDRGQLDTAITLLKRAVDTVPEGSSDTGVHYRDLGDAYMERFRYFGELQDSDLAMEAYTEALAGAGNDQDDKLYTLYQLGTCLIARGEQTRDATFIRRAVDTLEAALQQSSDDEVAAAQMRSALSGALFLLYQLEGAPVHLDRAAEVLRSALDQPDMSSEAHGIRCYNLASLLLVRFQQKAHSADLDESLRLSTLAAALLPERDRLRPLVVQAQALTQRSIRDRNDSDLETARKLVTDALRAVGRGSPEYAELKHALGTALCQQGIRFAHIPTLEDAAEALKEALATLPRGSLHVPGCWSNLGNVFRSLLEQTTRQEYLDEALRCYQNAVESAPSGPVSVQAAINLSTALMDAFEHRGADGRYFQKALAQLEKARDNNPGKEEVFLLLVNQSLIYARRHESIASMDDLERAIDLGLEALSLTSKTDSRQCMVLNNLAGFFKRRYDRIQKEDDIEAAIVYYRQALTLASPAEKPGILNGLATALACPVRHGRPPDRDVLTEAVDLHRQAVDLSQPGSRFHAARLHNYGNSFIDRFEISQDPADLANGLAQLKKAVAATPADTASRSLVLSSLATSLRIRPNRTAEHRREERRYFREACRIGLRNDLFHAFTGGQNWGSRSLKEGNWREAVIGLRYAATAMNRMLDRQLLRQDKETWLKDAQHLPADWAYALARFGKLEAAVEQLEQTRTRLLAQTIESALVRLEHGGEQTVSPEVLEQYRSLTGELLVAERIAMSEGTGTQQARERVRQIEQRLRSTLDELREEPAFAEYFSSPRFSTICSTLSPRQDEAGVYLLTTAAGTLALILHAGEVQPVWMSFQSMDLHSILYGTGERDGWLFTQVPETDTSDVLATVLPKLGEQIARPLAEALRKRFAGTGTPRIKLILTGTWNLLPLHAAPYGDGDVRCLLDEFIVSFAPSARAIIRPRQQKTSLPGDGVAFVGFAQTKFASPESALLSTRPEVQAIASLFPDHSTVLTSETPDLARKIARALGSADYIHLACHGSFHFDQPLESGLELGDGKLTMKQLLSEAPECRARLATLSACQSALTDGTRLPEETIGLPSTLLQFGVANVLGTLWMVEDDATALLMCEFYRRCRSGHGFAEALRSAQLWLRDLSGSKAGDALVDFGLPRLRKAFDDVPVFRDPYYWAAFQIIGEV